MLATTSIIFAVGFVVHRVNGKLINDENSVPLPCRFDVYDLNSNMVISVQEFMSATKGFTKMDRKTLFELFDRNGNKFIGVDEFKSVPQSISSAGIFDHCFRKKMVKRVCIGIGWGSRLQSYDPNAQLSGLNAQSYEPNAQLSGLNAQPYGLNAQDLGELTVGAQPSIAK